MKKIFLSVFVTVLMLMLHDNVSAQTKRYVKTVASGTGDGSSWANASANLQAMIDLSAPLDEVWVAKGTYKPVKNTGFTAAQLPINDPRFRSFVIPPGIKLYGGFMGNESSISLRNLGAAKTILSGDLLGDDAGSNNRGDNAYHVVLTAQNSQASIIDGFTIRDGNSSGMPQAFFNNSPYFTEMTNDGAGLFAYSSNHIIQNCIFSNNSTDGQGGAIYAYVSDSARYINCLFINNTASDGSVSFSEAAANINSRFVNCTMFGNSSSGSVCLSAFTSGNTIQNSIIWGNTVSGLAVPGATSLYSIIQNAFAAGNHSSTGTVDTDPVFTNAGDPDGADNILGSADDGLIPQCGPAIGGGLNASITLSKDLRSGNRVVNGTVDMGAYETSLSQAISSLTVTASDPTSLSDLSSSGYCNGRNISFITGTGNGGVFQWTRNGVNVGTNSNVYTTSVIQQNDAIRVTLTSAAGCDAAGVVQSNIINVNASAAAPAMPGSIIGPLNACLFINSPNLATYKIAKVPNAMLYHWSVNGNPGMTIVSHPNGPGINDTVVQVSFNSNFVPGNISVRAENYCGLGAERLAGISRVLPSAAGNIAGPTDVCAFMQSAGNPAGIPVTYFIRKVSNASSYNWTVPSGVIVNGHPGSGENDTSIVVTFPASFVSGSITVQAANTCGSSMPKSLSLTRRIPGTPGVITGPTDACPYEQSANNPAGIPATYTIRKVTYASTYQWTLPAGATAVHPAGAGANDTIINVTFSSSFSGGTISVTANTNCYTSAPRSLTIISQAPTRPYYIIGPTNVCSVMQSYTNPAGTPVNYTVNRVLAAASYNWTTPAGTIVSHPNGSGPLDTIITVLYTGSFTGGMITVTAVANCGVSLIRTLDVLRRLPSSPGLITASAPTACTQRRITYSLSAMPNYASSIQWTAPASGTIISGQGTTSIVVEFAGPTLPADSIKARSLNDCGISSERKLKVGVLPSCRASFDNPILITKENTSLPMEPLAISMMNNPTRSQFQLLIQTRKPNPVEIKVVDVNGIIQARYYTRPQSLYSFGDNLPAGVYIIQVKQDDVIRTVRAVKLK